MLFILSLSACPLAIADEGDASAPQPGLFRQTANAEQLDETSPLPRMPTAGELGPEEGFETPEGSTWDGMHRDPTLPQADNNGRLRGASLSERLEAIRRRAVDAEISRPFLTAEPDNEAQSVMLNEAVPPVKRRRLESHPTADLPGTSSQLSATASTRRQDPQPEPAKQPEPTPATRPAMPTPPPSLVMETPAVVPERVAASPVATERIEQDSNLLLTNRAPALSFETAGPRRIVIGKKAAYRVRMINMGEVDAHNIIVSVRLPSWAEVAAQTASVGAPKLETDDDQNTLVRWQIEQLPARDSEDLNLEIVPRDGRPFDLAVGWAFAPDDATTQIEVQEPKLEMTINGSEEVLYGETEVYTITISNPGSGPAENVVLNLLPVMAQQQVAGTRNLGAINAGERKTIELELTAHQAGRLQVKALAYAEGGLRTEVSQDVIVRRPNIDLVVMGPPRNYAATEAVFKVRLENTGDATAEDAVAVASLPAGSRFLAATDGGKYEADKGQVVWSIGSLRPGAVRLLEMQCELNSPGDNRVDIQCQADRDVRVAKSVVTVVEALADLKLYVNDPQGAISTGHDSIYEVRVVNRGTKSAEHVQIVGYFSEGIEPVSIRGWRGEVNTGQVTMEPIATLPPGQELVFRITARAQQPGNHVFRAELECRDPETRLATEEWTKYYSGGPADEARQASKPELGAPRGREPRSPIR